MSAQFIPLLTAQLLLFPLCLISLTYLHYWGDLLLELPTEPLSSLNSIVRIGVSYVLTLLISHWMYHSAFPKAHSGDFTRGFAVLFSASALTIVLLSAGIYSAFLWEQFYDAQAYHLPAIIELKNHWNPLQHPDICQWQRWACNLPNSTLSTHYPKSTWLLAANVYAITDWYETGKLFNLTTALVSVLVFYQFFSGFSGLRKIPALVLSVLTPVGTIVIKQQGSFYVDGIMGSYLAIVVGLLLNFVVHKNKQALWLLCCTLPVVSSIKFTGLAYSTIITLVFVMVYFKDFLQRRLILPALITAGLMALLCYNPYVTNYQLKGNPLYPAITPSRNVLENMAAADFLAQNRFQTLLQSLVSVSSEGNFLQPRPMGLKDLLRSETAVDERFGGFGGLMPLVLLAGIVVFAFYLRQHTTAQQHQRWLLTTTVALLASVIISQGNWWARLIPQLWLLPGLLAAGALLSQRPGLQKWGWGMLLLLSVQWILAWKTPASQWLHSWHLRAQYQRFQNTPVRLINNQQQEANIRAFRFANKTRLRDFGIQEVTGKHSCVEEFQYPGVMVCEVKHPTR